MTLVASASTSAAVFESTLPFWKCDSSDWLSDSEDDKNPLDNCEKELYDKCDHRVSDFKPDTGNTFIGHVAVISSATQDEESAAACVVGDSTLPMCPSKNASSEVSREPESDVLAHPSAPTSDKEDGDPANVPECAPTPPNTERPPDVRPKVFDKKKPKRSKTNRKGKDHDENIDEETEVCQARKRKSKRYRVRAKTNRKWRALDPFEMGFHLSLLPRPLDDDNTADGNESQDATDVSGVAESVPDLSEAAANVDCGTPAPDHDLSTFHDDGAGVGTMGTSLGGDETARLSLPHPLESGHLDEDDDEAFFATLGIDVTYSGPYADHVTDWDGLDFKHDITKDTKAKQTTATITMTRNAKPTPTAPSLPAARTYKYAHQLDFPTVVNLNKSDQHKLFELECSSTKRIYTRRDRDRRIQKAHKSVKSKNCKSVVNNKGRKKLYMHHRLYKMLDAEQNFVELALSRRNSPRSKSGWSDRRHKNVAPDIMVRKAPRSSPSSRSAPAQNLKYALHETNTPQGMENQLTNFLISIQHRELTPEDYDMLLRLDDSVKPKTVAKNVLKSLRTESVPASGLDVLCAVCMEPYTSGQERKFLPCGHDFHSACIDTWLNNSSMNCPLDGLPVEGS